MTALALWFLTPREFEALSDRYLSHHRKQDEQWATMAAMFYNAHKPKEANALTVEDFMPGAKPRVANRRHDKIALEAMMRVALPLKLEDVPDWAKVSKQ